ncbi:hypothetical protein LZ31DRAFT_382594 [Colletotrichum somersetense]|nr:hypothetical protein LZ31DRAFT_382594 [Colletotrichum somersetense]
MYGGDTGTLPASTHRAREDTRLAGCLPCVVYITWAEYTGLDCALLPSRPIKAGDSRCGNTRIGPADGRHALVRLLLRQHFPSPPSARADSSVTPRIAHQLGRRDCATSFQVSQRPMASSSRLTLLHSVYGQRAAPPRHTRWPPGMTGCCHCIGEEGACMDMPDHLGATTPTHLKFDADNPDS